MPSNSYNSLYEISCATDLMIELAALLLLGAVAGVIAGLLGVGGGLIIVPGLLFLFEHLHFPGAINMHMALGTSLASIIFTSLSSIHAHHQHAAVKWYVVAVMSPGILIGAAIGSVIADYLDGDVLRLFFSLFLLFAAIQMGLNISPNPKRGLPGFAGTSTVSMIIGMISAIVGIGGGTMTVPFLVWCNTNIRHAVGTSAAIGLPIAISAAISYTITGWNNPLLPTSSLGYIYLPAMLVIIFASMLFAPIGANLAHHLPVKKLKRFFAFLLAILSIRLLVYG